MEKLIDSFEKLCLQIIIDIILVPITVLRMFRQPHFCYDYPSAEILKPEEERFKNFLSPIKLSVYTSVFASIFFMNQTHDSSFFNKLSGLSITEKVLIVFVLNNLTPVIFSVVLTLLKKEPINSDIFKRNLFAFIYTSIYSSIPLFLLTIGLVSAAGINVDGFVASLEKNPELNSRVLLLCIFIFISALIAVLGFFKLFKAYNHILNEALNLKVRQKRLIATACFVAQVIYTYLLF